MVHGEVFAEAAKNTLSGAHPLAARLSYRISTALQQQCQAPGPFHILHHDKEACSHMVVCVTVGCCMLEHPTQSTSLPGEVCYLK